MLSFGELSAWQIDMAARFVHHAVGG